MKPLAHWAIHNQQKLRLQGRSEAEIWGWLVGPAGIVQPFRYDRQDRILQIGEDASQRRLQLDEYGFEIEVEAKAEAKAEAELEVNDRPASLDT